MRQRLLLLKNNMKIIKILSLFILSICIFNTSCHKPILITQDIIVPNWQNGEQIFYGIVRNDSLIGRTQYSIYFDVEGDIPVYCLEMLTDTEWQDDYLWDSSVVYFRRDNFAPIWSYRKVETDFSYSIIETHYDESDVDIWFETIDGKETFNLSLKEPYFDSEIILTLMRTVRFMHAKKYSFNTFTPLTLQLMSNSIRYDGKKIATTPAGSFECDKMQLTTPFSKFYLYYEQQEPRRLIHYQEKKSNIALVLLGDSLR